MTRLTTFLAVTTFLLSVTAAPIAGNANRSLLNPDCSTDPGNPLCILLGYDLKPGKREAETIETLHYGSFSTNQEEKPEDTTDQLLLSRDEAQASQDQSTFEERQLSENEEVPENSNTRQDIVQRDEYCAQGYHLVISGLMGFCQPDE